MQLVGSFEALVAADFYESIGEHTEKQHHAPEDWDFDDVAAEIATKANITTVNTLTTTVGTKATQAEMDALTATVATKAADSELTTAENAIVVLETFKGDTEEFFNYTDHVLVDSVTNAMIVQNLRVLSTNNATNVVGQTHADPELPGLFFADGTCTEALKLIDDARVEFALERTDPEENDGSILKQGVRLGAKNGENTATTRDQHDAFEVFSGVRYDSNGGILAAAAQTKKNSVSIRASRSQPNIAIEATGKDNDVDIMLVSTGPGAELFKMQSNGVINCKTVVARAYGAGQNAAEFENALGAMTFYIKDMGGFRVTAPSGNTTNLMELWNGPTRVFRVRSNGDVVTGISAAIVNQPSRTSAPQSGSTVVDPNSLYIGNSRYSYDMANRDVKLHKLKSNHIPVYLQAHLTANDLPTGHGLDHMTVNKWIDLARDELDNEDLDVHDIFPYANADWDVADAPNATLTSAYNAISADVTTLESEMDATEVATALNTAKTGISSGQASAITANTAKTGISSGQASAITANTAKVGISSGQASAISANTAKVGISSGQASAITANTSAVALRAAIDDPTFTTKIATPIVHTSEIMSQGSHLKIGSKDTNDLNIFLNNSESLQLTRAGQEIRYQSQGGSGFHRFMNNVYVNGSVNLSSGEKFKIANVDYLGNADNTSDADKPVSDATVTAIALKSNIASPTFTTKIVTPMVEAASNLELKATGSNAVKFYTDGSERCKVTSAGNLLFSTGLGLNLSKPVQSAIEWSAHQDLLEVTINTVRSASIPIYSSFSMSGVQRFFLEVTSDQIIGNSLIVAHTYSPNNYETWLPQLSNLRSMYVSASAGKFRITGAVSGTHSMGGNSTTNLYVNYMIM